MTKQRTSDPWMPADEYGRSLPRFTVNLLWTVPLFGAEHCTVERDRAWQVDPDFAAM